jgi:hypothetical protein
MQQIIRKRLYILLQLAVGATPNEGESLDCSSE